jgi:hypothetical protein
MLNEPFDELDEQLLRLMEEGLSLEEAMAILMLRHLETMKAVEDADAD